MPEPSRRADRRPAELIRRGSVYGGFHGVERVPLAESEPFDDRPTRERLSVDLDTSLFVGAGAGTGKTTSLVGRILSLVCAPGGERVPIGNIAAITFTEKAAAELRIRIASALNARLAELHAAPAAATGPVAAADESAALSAALDGLDGAAISTLHGFAARLLNEHPLEAGLPPSFETLDEVAGRVDFDERWSEFVDEMIDDPANHDWITTLDTLGASFAEMRAVALKFDENSDLLDWPAFDPASVEGGRGITRVNAGELLEGARKLVAVEQHCIDDDDFLLARCPIVHEFVWRLEEAETAHDRLDVLADERLKIPLVGNRGRKDNWPGVDLKTLREKFAALRERAEELVAGVADAAVRQCADALRDFTLRAADERRRAGRLKFHDLLVVCRNLLRSSEHAVEVRNALHERYARLLLDEFHDTDPIQIEIAALIAARPDGPVPAATAEPSAPPVAADWRTLPADPGHLFFVGDPKQSIYRFRRADIRLYDEARYRFGYELGDYAELSVNFRSVKPVVDWVNLTFNGLMRSSRQDPPGTHAQYSPLSAVREPTSTGTAVGALGADAYHTSKMADLRNAEAADVARAVATICAQRWTVGDTDPDTGAEIERPARLDDIVVLIPSRTCLPHLEAALGEAEIPYRLETASFVWSNVAIRDLVVCLQAVADPTDELSTVSALRSAVYGCGDDDLCRHAAAPGNGWDYTHADYREPPAETDGPVTAGLKHIRRLHDLSTTMTPAALLEKLVRDRQVQEQAAAWPRAREAWRHVRYLVDQARAWSDGRHSGLRHFIAWAAEQADARARVSAPVLPELDDDAVRIMTIHASKGLEFPIVILAGTQDTARPKAVSSDAGLDPAGGPPAIRLRAGIETSDYAQWVESEAVADHGERIRRLYVACTRARDHLLVSLYRTEKNPATAKKGEGPPPPYLATSAQLLHEFGFGPTVPDPREDTAQVLHIALTSPWMTKFSPKVKKLPDGFGTFEPDGEPGAGTPATRRSPLPDMAEWDRRRRRAVEASGRPPALSASAVAKLDERRPAATAAVEFRAGLAKDDAESEDETSRRGRYGTAFGSAVHGVLQRLDLRAATTAEQTDQPAASGAAAVSPAADLAALARQQAAAEGVSDKVDEIVGRVRAALAHPTVLAAAAARHWQEIYVGTNVGTAAAGIVVDGYIDLLYEDAAPSGGSGPTTAAADPDLVVLDFKTVFTDDEAVLGDRTEGYRLQGAAYAYGIGRATGRNVSRVEFAYLTPTGTVVHTVDGDKLEEDLAEVVRLAERAAAPAAA